jgi:hypothetical protein
MPGIIGKPGQGLRAEGPNEMKSRFQIFDTRGGQDQIFGINAAGEPNVLQRPNTGVDTSHFTDDPRKRPGFSYEGFTDPAVKSAPGKTPLVNTAPKGRVPSGKRARKHNVRRG